MAEHGPTNFGAPLSEKKFSVWFFGAFFSHHCHKYKRHRSAAESETKNLDIRKAPLNTKYIF